MQSREAKDSESSAARLQQQPHTVSLGLGFANQSLPIKSSLFVADMAACQVPLALPVSSSPSSCTKMGSDAISMPEMLSLQT